MARRNLSAVMALALVCGLLAGCGGSSSRLSRGAYKARLATVAKEGRTAIDDVEKARQATSVSEIEARLKAFAAANDRLGDEVSRLKPPKDAEAANAELARGEHDLAAAVRSLLPRVAKFTSPKAALVFLSESVGNAKGAHEEDQALGQLKKLGYTTG